MFLLFRDSESSGSPVLNKTVMQVRICRAVKNHRTFLGSRPAWLPPPKSAMKIASIIFRSKNSLQQPADHWQKQSTVFALSADLSQSHNLILLSGPDPNGLTTVIPAKGSFQNICSVFFYEAISSSLRKAL